MLDHKQSGVILDYNLWQKQLLKAKIDAELLTDVICKYCEDRMGMSANITQFSCGCEGSFCGEAIDAYLDEEFLYIDDKPPYLIPYNISRNLKINWYDFYSIYQKKVRLIHLKAALCSDKLNKELCEYCKQSRFIADKASCHFVQKGFLIDEMQYMNENFINR